MEAATVGRPVRPRRAIWMRRALPPLGFMSLPTALLVVFFLVPMVILAIIAFEWGPLSGHSGFTTSNFTSIFEDPLYRRVALTTFEIATVAMLAQLFVAVAAATSERRWSAEVAARAAPPAIAIRPSCSGSQIVVSSERSACWIAPNRSPKAS